jgi:hypothetical protein
MSYSGSTAATPNPPRLLVPAMSGPLPISSTSIYRRASQLWIYNTSDASTALMNAAYFTDGKQLGMQLGDMLMALCASTESSTGHVTVMGPLVTTASTAGWNLSTGGTLTSTFN